MPARESEALVLRTYPYREADLIVSFFTRDQGKLRGVARAVRRPKSRFGSGLERLSHVRLAYFLRENQDLARLDRCELCGPPFFLRADYATSVALDFLAEVSEQVLPEHEPNDAHFRLLLLVIDDIREGLKQAAPKQTASSRVDAPAQVAGAGSSSETGAVAVAERPPAGVSETPGWLWRAVTYFSLWSLRLGGWLPPLGVCIRGGAEFEPEETVYFSRSHPGLFSADYRDRDCWAMSPESRHIAGEMLKKPLPRLDERVWSRDTAEDLRRFLVQRLEAQIEHRLKTAAVLAEL
jgi:DNA repair protein RecO (recombination protein O)